MTENAIRLERRFAHPAPAVWAALTTPELLARWWAPGDIAPAVGHRFTMDMGALDGGTVLHHEHAGFRRDTPLGKQAIEGMGNGWPGLLAQVDEVLAQVS